MQTATLKSGEASEAIELQLVSAYLKQKPLELKNWWDHFNGNCDEILRDEC
jgi:hypothetical protein